MEVTYRDIQTFKLFQEIYKSSLSFAGYTIFILKKRG